MDILKKIRDSLVNVFSGLGTLASKSGNNQWVRGEWLSAQQIDTIYTESWLANAICSIPAEDATREWRVFNGPHAEEIARTEKLFDVQTLVAEAKTFSRAYGGSAILMLTNQNLEEPLNVSKIKQGDLQNLLLFDRFELSAPVINMTNPLKENYLMPEYYTLVNGSQRVHHSHFVRFEGARLPRRIATQYHGWGESELKRIYTDISNTVASFHGIAELMQEANVDVIKREGLAADLTTGQEQEIIKRYQLFNLMKGNFGLSLLDGSEELERHTLTLSGVAPVQEQLITWISGAAKIPVTRLFGTSAKGMNATGEGDERIYYDRIKGIQSRQMRTPLTQLDQVLVRSAIGSYPDDLDFEFNPLSQLSGEQQSSKEYTDSQTDRSYFDMGVVSKAAIAKKLQQNDVYQISDEEIEALEKAEEEEDYEDDFDLSEENAEPEKETTE